MQAVFFEVVFTGEAEGIGEHQLLWLELCEFDQGAYHPCHAWATRHAGEMKK